MTPLDQARFFAKIAPRLLTDDDRDGIYYEATCKLIGAWAYDPDAETVITFAGNRAELVEVLDEAFVSAWESDMGQRLDESGPDDNGDDAYDFWKDCA